MEYYKNFSLENLFYVNEEGLVCQEEWKNLIGFEYRYDISNLGRIKSLNYNHTKKPRLLKQNIDKYGYFTVCLFNKKRFYLKIHRLVGIHFIPNANNLPEINHKKGVKSDNAFYSLEWITTADNIRESLRLKLKVMPNGENCHWSKLTKEEALKIKYHHVLMTNLELAKKYNVSRTTISAIRNNKNWKHI